MPWAVDSGYTLRELKTSGLQVSDKGISFLKEEPNVPCKVVLQRTPEKRAADALT